MGPWSLWASSVQMTQLALETQTVVGLRLLGMAGMWPVARSESSRMWTEKPAAFVEAGGAAFWAAAAGKSPEEVLDAAVRPIRKRTRANSKRLSRRRAR